MPNPVSYFELGGRNAAKLSEFYSDLFGWKIEQHAPAAAFAEYYRVEAAKEGIAGGIIQTSGEMPPNYLMVYITVDDLQACLDKAESLGGEIVVTPFEMPGGMGQIAVFRDPDGNTIGLHKS